MVLLSLFLLFLHLQIHEPDPILRANGQLSFEGFARFLMDTSNDAIVPSSNKDCLDFPLSRYLY